MDIIQGTCQNVECVCEPLNRLQARAAEHLVRLSGSIQCAVTPIKLCLLTDQQSVVVAMWSTALMTSVTAFIISLELLSIIVRRVRHDIIFAFGRSSFTKFLKGSCSTTKKGWSPCITYFTTALFMAICDTVQLLTNVVCLLVDGVSEVLFLFVDVSSPYILR